MAYQYNPYAPAMPYMPQIQQMPQMQQVQQMQPQTNVNWIYVNGIEGARNQIVSPGSTAWMMDNNDSLMYYKAVSATGQPTLKVFRFAEASENLSTPAAPDLSAYATKAEVAALTEKLDKIVKEFGGIVS